MCRHRGEWVQLPLSSACAFLCPSVGQSASLWFETHRGPPDFPLLADFFVSPSMTSVAVAVPPSASDRFRRCQKAASLNVFRETGTHELILGLIGRLRTIVAKPA